MPTHAVTSTPRAAMRCEWHCGGGANMQVGVARIVGDNVPDTAAYRHVGFTPRSEIVRVLAPRLGAVGCVCVQEA